MNLKKIIVPVLSCAALVLGGCSQKVDYATFHEKATQVEGHTYTSCEVSYAAESKNASAVLKFGVDAAILQVKVWAYESGDNELATAAILMVNTQTAASVTENEGVGYYFTVGNGFCTIDEEDGTTFVWESHGLITSYTDGSEVYTFNYK